MTTVVIGSDFFKCCDTNAVFFLSPGNVKKCSTKKMKSSDRPSRNLQDVLPHASLEEIKQRKVFDLRRW